MQDIKSKIIEEQKKGNIVILTPNGFALANLEQFVKQPTDGILYDLNRDEATILTFIDDPNWVNDYATAQVIRKLKEQIDRKTRRKPLALAMGISR